jgi:hypothetical protein
MKHVTETVKVSICDLNACLSTVLAATSVICHA